MYQPSPVLQTVCFPSFESSVASTIFAARCTLAFGVHPSLWKRALDTLGASSIPATRFQANEVAPFALACYLSPRRREKGRRNKSDWPHGACACPVLQDIRRLAFLGRGGGIPMSCARVLYSGRCGSTTKCSILLPI